MNPLDALQHKVGFTRTEAIAILLLSATFLVGMGIRWARATYGDAKQAVPHFDYAKTDSAYNARRTDSLQRPSNAITIESIADISSRREKPQRAGEKKNPSQHSININNATKSQLMNLPGIGESYAERIIAYRKASGGFRSVSQLTNVKGIGEKKLEKIRAYVRVE